jgi:hypothetical protein
MFFLIIFSGDKLNYCLGNRQMGIPNKWYKRPSEDQIGFFFPDDI